MKQIVKFAAHCVISGAAHRAGSRLWDRVLEKKVSGVFNKSKKVIKFKKKRV